MNNHQLIDNIMPNDMVRTHSDAVLEDQRTRAIPKQTEYEKACADFESRPHNRVTIWHPEPIAHTCREADCQQKPKADHPTGDAMVEHKRPDEWHSEAPPVAGVYWSCVLANTGGPLPGSECRRWFDGAKWHWGGDDYLTNDQIRAISSLDKRCNPTYWSRLVEADAKPGAQGWVEWDPKPDSICPVPDGVQFEARLRDGRLSMWVDLEEENWALGYGEGDKEPHPLDIIAYRILGE